MNDITRQRFSPQAMVVGDSVADRMLQVLEADYLYTLQAEDKRQHNCPQKKLGINQGHHTVNVECSTVSGKDAEMGCDLKEIKTKAAECTGAGHAVPTSEKEQLRAELLQKLSDEAEGENSDSDSEPLGEFAYERLSSTEELPPAYSLSEGDDDGAQGHKKSSGRHSRNEDSPEPSNGANHSLDYDVQVSTGVISAQKVTVDHSAWSSIEPQPHAVSEGEFMKGREKRPEATEEQQLQGQKSNDLPAEQRPLRRDMPLDPESAAFITKVMNGLTLRNPREKAPPKLFS